MRYVYRVVAVLLFGIAQSAFAACPNQETTVFYVNGVDTLKTSARRSMQRLRDVVFATGKASEDCVKFDYAYNTNEPLFLDFMEAGLQKMDELGQSPTVFWRNVFRVAASGAGNVWFLPLVDAHFGKAAQNVGQFVLGDQVDEHLATYREHLDQNRRVILLPHSQGNLYANQEWSILTAAERARVHIVAAATPAQSVADGGNRYVTLHEDNLARFLFVGALPANAANSEPCEDRYICHGFKESYMKGASSQQRLVNHVIALLPVPITGGTIIGQVKAGFFDAPPVVGGKVVLYSWSLVPLAQAVTDSEGRYSLSGVTPGIYYVEAEIRSNVFDSKLVTVTGSQTVFANFPVLVPL